MKYIVESRLRLAIEARNERIAVAIVKKELAALNESVILGDYYIYEWTDPKVISTNWLCKEERP